MHLTYLYFLFFLMLTSFPNWINFVRAPARSKFRLNPDVPALVHSKFPSGCFAPESCSFLPTASKHNHTIAHEKNLFPQHLVDSFDQPKKREKKSKQILSRHHYLCVVVIISLARDDRVFRTLYLVHFVCHASVIPGQTSSVWRT